MFLYFCLWLFKSLSQMAFYFSNLILQTAYQTLILLTIVYPYLGSHPLMTIPYILGTLIVVWLIAKIIRPELFDVVGSGVPQIEAILIGKHQMNWWSVLWRKFVSGLLTICPELFLVEKARVFKLVPVLVKDLWKMFTTIRILKNAIC